MEPVYIDLHIHTSENPERLNAAYDVAILHEKVQECAMGSPCLISLTDHNTINKVAYLNATSLFPAERVKRYPRASTRYRRSGVLDLF